MTESPESRCRRNVHRWIAEVDCPVAPVVQAFPDHAYLGWSPELSVWLRANMDTWTLGTNLKDHRPWGVKSAIWGGRERRARWAVQVVEHFHPDTGSRMVEWDVDASNPNWGAALTLWHGLADWFWQKARKHKTDSFKVAAKRGWLDTPQS